MKDYLNVLLGMAFLAISIVFIPEIRDRKTYWGSIVLGIVVLAILGIDKINRDNKKDTIHEDKRLADSTQIANLSRDILNLRIADSLGRHQIDSSLKQYNLTLAGNKAVPIINTTINVTSKNQSGGQTAAQINNNPR